MKPGTITTVDQVPVSCVFKPANDKALLSGNTQFIKLNGLSSRFNVINTANWLTGWIDEHTQVVALGPIFGPTIIDTLRKLAEGYAILTNTPLEKDVCLSFKDQAGMGRFLEGREEAKNALQTVV